MGDRIEINPLLIFSPLFSKADIGQFVLTLPTALYEHAEYVTIYLIHSHDKKSCDTN